MPDTGLNPVQRAVKRGFDIGVSAVLLVPAAPVIGVAAALARFDTGSTGIFRQDRIGRDGAVFTVHKIRTMRATGRGTTVTTKGDARITRLGAAFRKLKIDELPQLWDVLRGEMSLVGPRPDVPGFADTLTDQDRIVLSVRPGITCPAAIAYRHEEDLLAAVDDPDAYNREVIWPDKVRMNREYVENWSLRADIRCLLDTVRSVVSTEGEPAREKEGHS